MQEIKAERGRQIEVEIWSPEHDDQHEDGELLQAGVIYYLHAKKEPLTFRDDGAPLGWPWDAAWWKPKEPHRDLVRAGALCLAERDRLRRRHASVEHVHQKLRLIVGRLASLQEQSP